MKISLQAALIVSAFCGLLVAMLLNLIAMRRVDALEGQVISLQANQRAIAQGQTKLADAVSDLAHASIKNSEAITHLVRVLGGR